MRIFLIALCALAAAACDKEVAGGRADGAAIYAEACARCHGPEGAPPPGMALQLGVPDLTSAVLHQRLSDEDMRRRILEGAPAQGMPAFAGALTDAQVDAVIRHVRALREQKQP